MTGLIDGYRRFRATDWRKHRTRFEELAEGGQSPRALVIACSDSRVDPQMIFHAAPGELFVVRNVANLVPPYAPNSDYHGTSAALEFAVRSLGVQEVVVMGHNRCGGIAALLRGPTPETGDFVGPWMQIAASARDRALAQAPALAEADRSEALHRLCEHEGVRVSLANLMTFPWLRARVEAGNLTLHGYHFDIRSGDLVPVDAAEGIAA